MRCGAGVDAGARGIEEVGEREEEGQEVVKRRCHGSCRSRFVGMEEVWKKTRSLS